MEDGQEEQGAQRQMGAGHGQELGNGHRQEHDHAEVVEQAEPPDKQNCEEGEQREQAGNRAGQQQGEPFSNKYIG